MLAAPAGVVVEPIAFVLWDVVVDTGLRASVDVDS
jgi:hypothetical protein